MQALIDRLSRAERSALAVTGIVLAIVLFLSVNLFSALILVSARTDLTEDKLFTLTDATREVLGGLTEPLTLRLFESDQLMEVASSLNVYSDRVHELLRTYQDLSNGMIQVEIVNTIPFSSEEDRAIQFRLRGIQVSQQGEQGYFGLVGSNSTDDIEIISLLSPDREAFLEYDLTRMVIKLSDPEPKVVGVIDGLGIMGREFENIPPWAIIQQMRQTYEVRLMVYDANEIPPNADVMLVVHPNRLSERTLYAIEQYVLSGKPAIIVLDTLAENSPKDPQNPLQYLFPESELEPLLSQWGLAMPVSKVVGDRQMALRVSGFAGPQRITTDMLPWLQIRPEAFNHDDVITGRLQLMRMSSAGSLQSLGVDGIEVTPLIQSTRDSMLIEAAAVRRRGDPNDLLNAFEPDGLQHILAARVTGTARTAFPDGPPELNPRRDEEPDPDYVEPEQILEGPLQLVVLADADALADSHVIDAQSGRNNSNNGDFLINAVENLAGGGALIGLRGRGLSNRPFTTLEAIEDAARAQYFETEQRLQAELEETQNRLAQLQGLSRADIEFELLTQEEQEAIIEFNRRMLTLRQQLRDVRRALGQDIDRLETELQFANIAAVPILVVIFGIAAALVRRARLRRARALIR